MKNVLRIVLLIQLHSVVAFAHQHQGGRTAVVYNCLSACKPGRLHEILDAFKYTAVVGLVGTRFCQGKQQIPVELTKHKKFHLIHANYNKGVGNKHTGLTIALHRQYFSAKSIVSILWPTQKTLQGRCLAARVKAGALD